MDECIHYSKIDENNHGVCQKCGAERDYPPWDQAPYIIPSKDGRKQISIQPRRPGTGDIFSKMGKRRINR